MNKYIRQGLKGLKFALYLGTFTLTGSFVYLQYINSKIGKIDIDSEITSKHYIEKYNIP